MTVSLVVDGVKVPVKTVNFSDGSSNIQLLVPDSLQGRPPSSYYSISVDPTTPTNKYLWEICQVIDAIEHTFGKKIRRELLHLPYLPHARADRVFESGNGHPLKLFLDAVSWRFDEIFLTDPHSAYYQGYEEEYCELLGKPNFVVKYQHQCFIETIRDIKSGSVLVSPDNGAKCKIYKLQQALDVRTISTFVVEADKKRDVSTGRISETTLPEDFDYVGKTFYIVDDICDAGGTFIPLAKKLKDLGAKEVNLYVTHMIGAKGLDLFKGIIDNIHCYHIVGKYLTMKDVQEYSNSTIKIGY